MNIIKRMILFFLNIFEKKEIKKLEAPAEPIKEQTKASFAETLKINIENKQKSAELETPICVGDGLGIKKKMSY